MLEYWLDINEMDNPLPMELDMNATLIPHEMEVSSWEKQGTKLNGRFSSQSYTRGLPT